MKECSLSCSWDKMFLALVCLPKDRNSSLHFYLRSGHFHVRSLHFHLPLGHFHVHSLHFHLPSSHFHVRSLHFHLPSGHFHVRSLHFHLPSSHFHVRSLHLLYFGFLYKYSAVIFFPGKAKESICSK